MIVVVPSNPPLTMRGVRAANLRLNGGLEAWSEKEWPWVLDGSVGIYSSGRARVQWAVVSREHHTRHFYQYIPREVLRCTW